MENVGSESETIVGWQAGHPDNFLYKIIIRFWSTNRLHAWQVFKKWGIEGPETLIFVGVCKP